MADTAETLLSDVKEYLAVTWDDEKTNSKIKGYISRGMARLQSIAGASLSFTDEGPARSLLLDYCRYANSQALEVFEQNFERALMDLYLSVQAPIVAELTVLAESGNEGYALTVAPAADDGDSYVYQLGSGLGVPAAAAVCAPGGGWTVWDGEALTASAGSTLVLVEIDTAWRARRAGKVVLA